MAAYHDIIADKGSAFRYHFKVEEENGTAIPVSSARMQVRKSKETQELLLDFSVSGVSVFYFGATGQTFSAFSSVGGISMNYSFGGTQGDTGSMFIYAPASIMSNLADGNWLYDVTTTISGDTERIIQGRFICDQRVTK